MATSPSLLGEKTPWWLTSKKIADKYVKEARVLTSSQSHESSLELLEAALALYPRLESALELKARVLFLLHRYGDIADMLREYIPSFVKDSDSENSSGSLSSEGSKLLLSPERGDAGLKCFSVSDFKKKLMGGLGSNSKTEGHWRYLVLGQACMHLGIMEDAIFLLQTGKRLATASLRQVSTNTFENGPVPPLKTEARNITLSITHIKQLLRRKTAALAALDAGFYSDSIRHCSKILESRRGGPQAFLAECYMYRASAYKSSNQIVDSIADCNKALALDPSSIDALSTRATLFESIRCLPDSLHDLEHLKLLYNSILRDRKLPGPVWKKRNFSYGEIPGKMCALAAKIQELKLRVSKWEAKNVDYYGLIGLKRGCSRSELSRLHLLLTLRHKPDRSNGFLERCEFADERDVSSVRERAKMSALLLFRLIQKAYTSLMATVLEEEAMERHKFKAKAALQAALVEAQQINQEKQMESKKIGNKVSGMKTADLAVYQGVFCRDIGVVGNMLSQTGFDHPIPLKYEALSC